MMSRQEMLKSVVKAEVGGVEAVGWMRAPERDADARLGKFEATETAIRNLSA